MFECVQHIFYGGQFPKPGRFTRPAVKRLFLKYVAISTLLGQSGAIKNDCVYKLLINLLLFYSCNQKLFNALDLQDILLQRTKFYENISTKASENHYRKFTHLSDSENVKFMKI